MPLYHCVISSLTDRQSLLPSAPLHSAPPLRETLSVVVMQPVLLRQSVQPVPRPLLSALHLCVLAPP